MNILHLVLCSAFEEKIRSSGSRVRRVEPILEPIELGYVAKPDPYIVWIGRVHPDKDPESVARFANNSPLPVIAVGPSGRDCAFPPCSNLFHIGPAAGQFKRELLTRAAGLLYMASPGWVEAGGMVISEALACGVPVLGRATPHSSPLVSRVRGGIDGFVETSIECLATQVGRLSVLNRGEIRRYWWPRLMPLVVVARRIALLKEATQPSEPKQKRTLPILAPQHLEEAMISTEDLKILFDLAAGLQSGAVVVGVGACVGACTICLAEAMKPCNGRVYAVDTFPDNCWSESFLDAKPGRQGVWRRFQMNVTLSGLASYIEPLRMTSEEALALFSSRSVDLIFLDLDHAFEKVSHDLRGWWERLRPNGLLVCHDFRSHESVGTALRKFTRAKAVGLWPVGEDLAVIRRVH